MLTRPDAWLSDANALMERNLFAVISYESERAEAERLATEAEAARPKAPVTPPAPVLSGYPTTCEGHVVAPQILMRESGCSYTAYNATGCSGRGCIGLYQLDEGHFYAVSPWNSKVSGVCYGLSFSPADQDECASRLGPSAWQ